MSIVDPYDAKARLSELVRRASEGEEIVIARHGRPVARLVAVAPERRPPGGWEALPRVHREPFDPRLVAQAREEGLTLATHDDALRAYGVALLHVP